MSDPCLLRSFRLIESKWNDEFLSVGCFGEEGRLFVDLCDYVTVKLLDSLLGHAMCKVDGYRLDDLW